MHEMSSEGYPPPLPPPRSPPVGGSSLASSSSTTFLEPTYRRSNSTTIAVSPPLTGRHRRLPPTPQHRFSARRCSSPRFLPAPPSPAAAISPDFFHSVALSLERRPSSGRRLPKPPVTMTTSVAGVPKYCGAEGDGVGGGDVAASDVDNEWPSPTRSQRKFSDVRKGSLVASRDGDGAILPSMLFGIASDTAGRSPQRIQQKQQQQPATTASRFNQSRGSLDRSSGTPSSTNAPSQSSSLSPSIEQVSLIYIRLLQLDKTDEKNNIALSRVQQNVSGFICFAHVLRSRMCWLSS